MRASPRRLWVAGLVGLGLLVIPAAARAQDQAAPNAADAERDSGGVTIQPPTLKKDPGAIYPKQAIDEGITATVEVPLTLDIDPNGKVTRAVSDHPIGHGFDEAAVAAAQNQEWDPALRFAEGALAVGGAPKPPTPVASRIRFVYKFAPPPSALSGQVQKLSGSRPIEGATVVARDAAGAEHTATTDTQGAWRIEGLKAGTYHLVISAPGMEPHEADEQVKPGEEASAVDRLEPPKPVEAPRRWNGGGGPGGRGEGREAPARGDEADARAARDQSHPRHGRRRPSLPAEPPGRGEDSQLLGVARRARRRAG